MNPEAMNQHGADGKNVYVITVHPTMILATFPTTAATLARIVTAAPAAMTTPVLLKGWSLSPPPGFR